MKCHLGCGVRAASACLLVAELLHVILAKLHGSDRSSRCDLLKQASLA